MKTPASFYWAVGALVCLAADGLWPTDARGDAKLIRQLAAEAAREVIQISPGDLKVLDLEFEARDAIVNGDKDAISLTRVKTKRGDQIVIQPLKVGVTEIVVPRIKGDAELGLRVEVHVEEGAALGRKQELKTVLVSERSEMRAERTGLQLKVGAEHVAQIAFVPATNGGIQIGNTAVVQTSVAKVKGKHEFRIQAVAAGRSAILLRDDQGKVRARYLVTVEP